MKTRKLIAILLAMVLAFAVFTPFALSSSTDDDDDEGNGQGQQPAPSTVASFNYDDTDNGEITVIFINTAKTIDLTLQKVWKDGIIPDSQWEVTFILTPDPTLNFSELVAIANAINTAIGSEVANGNTGESTITVTLTGSGDSGSITIPLPAYSASGKITWNVTEAPITGFTFRVGP